MSDDEVEGMIRLTLRLGSASGPVRWAFPEAETLEQHFAARGISVTLSPRPTPPVTIGVARSWTFRASPRRNGSELLALLKELLEGPATTGPTGPAVEIDVQTATGEGAQLNLGRAYLRQPD